jgi:hypothetical protein
MREDINDNEKLKKNVEDLGLYSLESSSRISGYMHGNFRTSFRKYDIEKEIPSLVKIINYFRS